MKFKGFVLLLVAVFTLACPLAPAAAAPPELAALPPGVSPAPAMNGPSPAVASPALEAVESVHGTPAFLRGALGCPGGADPALGARRFLDANRALLRLQNPDNDFALKTVSTDGLGLSHVKFGHTWRGIPVWPEEVIVHLNPQGFVYCFNGDFREIALDTAVPAVSASAAAATAETAHPCPAGVRSAASLVVYAFLTDTPRLAWEVELTPARLHPYRFRVFVDAHTGAILNSVNEVPSGYATTSTGVLIHNSQSVTLNTWHDDDGYTYLVDASKPMFPGTLDPATLRGTLAAFDGSGGVAGAAVIRDPNGDNIFNDSIQVAAGGTAAYHMSRTWDYFRNTHNWNSADNAGGPILMMVNNVADPDNATCADPNHFYFGSGGTSFYNLAAAVDVVAHEFTHGVTQSSCNLVYQYQPGALNESMSDVFGSALDNNWLLAETVIRPETGAAALRNMADPHNGHAPGSPFWQPAHMSEYVSTTSDYGGVHLNNGIPNKAYYLAATAIGRAKAERIYFRALVHYFTQSTDFKGGRAGLEQAAVDLHGNGSAEHQAIQSAFDAVGITAGTAPSTDSHLYFPLGVNFTHHGKTFNASVWIVNPGDAAATYTLNCYTAQATAAGSTGARSLAAHAMEGWTLPANSLLGVLTSDRRLIGVCDHENADRHLSVATTPAEIFTSATFVPHIPYSDTGWFSVCGVGNVSTAQSSVIFADNADKGAAFNLGTPNSGAFFDFEAMYDQLYGYMPNPTALGGLWGAFFNFDLGQNKALDPNLVGAEIFGVKSGYDCAGLNLDPFVSQTLLFSHIANPPLGWWTGIAFVSLAVDPDTGDGVTTHPILVTAYSSGGQVLKQTLTGIPYLGKQAYLAHTWTVGGQRVIPDEAVWVTVASTSAGHPITGYELFGLLSPPAGVDSLAGLEAAKFVGQKLIFPKIVNGNAQGDGYVRWTGIAVINPNASTANLTYRLYSSSGALVATRNRAVGPYLRDIGYAGDLFGVGDFLGWVVVDSSLPITGFELYGYQDNRSLAGATVFY